MDDANAYELMADADQAKGDAKSEAAILTAYEHEGGQMPDALKRLATLRRGRWDNQAEAAATLERLNYIYPVKDEDLHRRLGDLLYAQKQYEGAIREYSALVGVEPRGQGGRAVRPGAGVFCRGTEGQGRRQCAGERSKPLPATAQRRSCCWSCRKRP